MICKKCEKEVPDGPFCLLCGARQQELGQRKKSRGNGQGSVYQLKNKSYIAVKTLGWYLDENGKKRRRIASKCFKRKKDAVEALPTLGIDKSAFAKSEKKSKNHPATAL